MTRPEGVKLEYCPNPKCRQRSLFWNQTKQLWECLNPECRRIYTSNEFSEYWYNKQSDQPTPQVTQTRKAQQISFAAPLWLVNILESKRFWKLLICSAVIWWCWTTIQYSGNSIGLAFGLAVPILLLYAIKAILRKFLNNYGILASQHHLSQVFYSIRKSSFLRFAIILATIALLATTIWSMFSLIYRLTQSASPVYLFNMLVLIIAQIWLLSWLCGMLKHSRQISNRPKFAIVFWSLFAVAIFCAFVGISPFSDMKNTITTTIANWWEQTTIASTPPPNTTPPNSPSSPSQKTVSPPKSNSGKVWIDSNTYLVGGDWSAIILTDNPNASNPTLSQLVAFLKNDRTDLEAYTPTHVCADFAEEIHNRAEQQGIKAALVTLTGVDHALNAFQTTDAGLIFVDCTGGDKPIYIHTFLPNASTTSYGGTTSWDKIAYVKAGSPLGIISLDTAAYYGFSYSSFEQWKSDKALFDAKLNAYTRQVGGRTYVSQAEYYQLQIQSQEIGRLAERLGAFWEEMGVVQNYQIFWEGK